MKRVVWILGVCVILLGGEARGRGAGEGVAVELEGADGRTLKVSIVGIEGEDVVAVDAKGARYRIPLAKLSDRSAGEVRDLRRRGELAFGAIPRDWKGRLSAESRRRASGGEDVEEAVTRGLDYLKSMQRKDGSWGEKFPSAMTGLALLCYLGHAETPLSEGYGGTVLRGMTHLINLGVLNSGKLVRKVDEQDKHWPYEHAIATCALAEGMVFCRQLGIRIPKLPEITQQAGQCIIDKQHKSGGWDYGYDGDSARGGDLSITSWQIQAVRACYHTGLEFRGIRECVAGALEFVEQRHDSAGGFGYTGNGPAGGTGYHTLTGAGMLCRQIWNRGSSFSVRSGARYLQQNSKFDYDTEFCDLYGHYYESQALRNRGGEVWQTYRDRMIGELKAHQRPDGSWENPGGGKKPRAVAAAYVGSGELAELYRACLCTLILESGYRNVMVAGSRGGD